MTQIADEYRSAHAAFAEALAFELGLNPDAVGLHLASPRVEAALDDLHAAWLQFSDEQDFGAEIAKQDLLDAMSGEAGLDERRTLEDEEEAAWREHCTTYPMDMDNADWTPDESVEDWAVPE